MLCLPSFKAKLLLDKAETNSLTKTKDNRNAVLMLKLCTPLQLRTLRYSHTKTDNRSLSAEIQVGLLFKAKDLVFSEKDGASAKQANKSYTAYLLLRNVSSENCICVP